MTDSLEDALHAVVTVADLVRDGRLGRVRVQIGDLSIDVTAPETEIALRTTASVLAAEVGPVDLPSPTSNGSNGHRAVVDTAEVVTAPALQALTAPLMGVFFRAPAPDRPPFVAVADRVEAGQQIAVIEAMKLMNPVLADRAGVVREVHVADGEVVEFEQPLISIEPV